MLMTSVGPSPWGVAVVTVATDPARTIDETDRGDVSAFTATMVPVAGVTGVPATVMLNVVVVGDETTANCPLYPD